jgi:hypothetical protein
LPYETAEELQVEITKLTMSIQRMKAKIKGIDLPIDEEVNFALVFTFNLAHLS